MVDQHVCNGLIWKSWVLGWPPKVYHDKVGGVVCPSPLTKRSRTFISLLRDSLAVVYIPVKPKALGVALLSLAMLKDIVDSTVKTIL